MQTWQFLYFLFPKYIKFKTGRFETRRFETWRFVNWRFETGRFETGRFETGRFETGRFETWRFETWRFVGVPFKGLTPRRRTLYQTNKVKTIYLKHRKAVFWLLYPQTNDLKKMFFPQPLPKKCMWCTCVWYKMWMFCHFLTFSL